MQKSEDTGCHNLLGSVDFIHCIFSAYSRFVACRKYEQLSLMGRQ